MDLNTKYSDLAGGEENKGKKTGVESTHSKDPNANVGTGPAPAIADGGTAGEAKRPNGYGRSDRRNAGNAGCQ
jgi:hypothetical protein